MEMSEEVTRRNLLAIKDYSEKTRTLFRDIEDEYLKEIRTLKSDVESLKAQVQALQVRLYSGGATSL